MEKNDSWERDGTSGIETTRNEELHQLFLCGILGLTTVEAMLWYVVA